MPPRARRTRKAAETSSTPASSPTEQRAPGRATAEAAKTRKRKREEPISISSGSDSDSSGDESDSSEESKPEEVEGEEQQQGRAKRRRTGDTGAESRGTKDPESEVVSSGSESSESSDSDPDYEPSASEPDGSSSSAEDAPTSASSSDDDDADSGSGSDSDSGSGSGSDSDSGSDSGSGSDGEGGDAEGDGGEGKAREGRVVGGRTLRAPSEDAAATDHLRLADIGQEILMLDAESACPAVTSTEPGARVHQTACVKGRVFVAGDRVLLDGHLVEIVGFQPQTSADAAQVPSHTMWVHWLLSGAEVGGGVRHGNYARAQPAVRVPLRSDSVLTPATAGPSSTIKVTHGMSGSLADRAQLISHLKNNKPTLAPVTGDKGRSRPRLFGTDKRWNAGEQKKLLMFLRRVWPSCARPSSVTIPMRPAAHKDTMSAPDDYEDDVADMDAVTSKYHTLWDSACRRASPDCQRWMANTFDTLRRLYIEVKPVDWETAYRELWAAADLILPPSPSPSASPSA